MHGESKIKGKDTHPCSIQGYENRAEIKPQGRSTHEGFINSDDVV